MLAYRRALRSLDLLPHARRGRFEPNMLAAVLAFQTREGIGTTGTIGRRTYRHLYPHIDAFGRTLLQSWTRRHAVRLRMVAEQKWALRNEPQIHYPAHDDRPLGSTRLALDRWGEHELPILADYSEYAACVAAAAGAPDPNGTAFGTTGQVFTGTMLSHSTHLQKRELQPGDYVIFGASTGEHVCLVLAVDDPDDPLLTSHGQDQGPIQIRLSQEARFHNPPITFLSAGLP